jgi:hypothetical protein
LASSKVGLEAIPRGHQPPKLLAALKEGYGSLEAMSKETAVFRKKGTTLRKRINAMRN